MPLGPRGAQRDLRCVGDESIWRPGGLWWWGRGASFRGSMESGVVRWVG